MGHRSVVFVAFILCQVYRVFPADAMVEDFEDFAFKIKEAEYFIAPVIFPKIIIEILIAIQTVTDGQIISAGLLEYVATFRFSRLFFNGISLKR